MVKKIDKKLLKQILRFLVVGGTAFLIDYGVFALLDHFGMYYIYANIISFSVSVIFNYIASVTWVYDARKQTPKEAIIFLLLSIVGLGINSLIMWIGVDLIGIHQLITKLGATGVVMVYNFISRKILIEDHKPKEVIEEKPVSEEKPKKKTVKKKNTKKSKRK